MHIGYNFFPEADPTTQVINAFVVFAGGFIMRPLGGVLFGHVSIMRACSSRRTHSHAPLT